MTSATGIVGRHRVALVLAGALLLATGSWIAASAYAKPIRTESTMEITSWTERASYTYTVPVTRNSTIWPIGTALPMGEPAYFRTVSEAILVDFAWVPDLAGGARGVAAAEMVLQVRAQDPEGRAYWAIQRALDETRTDDLPAGVALSGRVDLDSLVREVKLLQDEMPTGDAVINWSVATTVVYAMEGANGPEQAEVAFYLPIDAADPRFVLPTADELTWEIDHGERRTSETRAAAGWPGVLGSVKSLALAAIGLVALAAGALAPATPGGAAFDRELRKFRDWVSVAQSVPDDARNAAPLVDVGTLEDLVHVAADARTRVVVDQGTRVFYALLPGVTYRYARHEAPAPG